ncbi:MAG: ABC transporter permease [Bacteroidales bacterium]|nr:ABC transporter permease [Bacteroidales bacterium]
MNTELFIAKRIITQKGKNKRFSGSIVGIAVFGIALGLAVMIVAVAIVTGFKKEISGKVTGFASHIQLVNLDSNTSYETTPVNKSIAYLDEIKNIPGVRHVQQFAIKAGIIKTKENIQGAVLKGAGPDFEWEFIDRSIIEGEPLRINDSLRTNNVLISKATASMLQLELGDSFNMYFIQDPPRARRFTISGVYQTSLTQFDKLYIYADIKHIQRLNNWQSDQVSGFEIMLNDIRDAEDTAYRIRELAAYNLTGEGSNLKVIPIQEKYNQIFDWLNLQDMNVIIIIILMLVVAGFNMVSGLLILILERTNMIGILKGLGTRNASVRKIFLYQSGYLAFKGLLWGNIIGIALCLLQSTFHLISLDPESYYLDTVPVNLNFVHLLLLNGGTLLSTFIFLIIPSMIIARVSPEKAIRFN